MTKRYPKDKCLSCGMSMTWAGQRRQFRATSAGLTPEEAKVLMPRCQKCTTRELNVRGLHARAREGPPAARLTLTLPLVTLMTLVFK
jgi:hypothetical protein